MMKKILSVIAVCAFIGGVPFFAVAVEDPCATANSFYTPPGCANSSSQVSGAGTVGGPVNVSGAGTVGGGTQSQGQGTPFGTDPNAPKLQNPIKFNSFSELAAQVTKTAVEILLPFVVLAFIWSGFLFVRAQGNQTELENAKKNIWWSIIGAFILMGAWGFATMISQTVETLTK